MASALIDMIIGLPLTKLLALLSFSLLLASGQILFKFSAMAAPKFDDLSSIAGLLRIPSFWMALVLYGLATLLWVYILQQLELSKAYPFAALGFVLVPLAGRFWFEEAVGGVYWIGVLCIILGILLTSIRIGSA